MKSGIDFLFLFLNTPFGAFKGFSYHIGAARIISLLRGNGFTAEQFVPDRPYSLHGLAAEIMRLNPRHIGFSVYDVHFPLIAELSAHIKQLSSDVLVVIGGPTATFSDHVVLENYPQIDLCVRGEGELTALELAAGSRRLAEIPGITFRQDGRVIRNPDRPLMSREQLNSFPSVYADDLIPLELAAETGIITSRGCPYQCTYCQFSALAKHRIRYYDDARVLEELSTIGEFLRRTRRRLECLPVHDEGFTLNRERTLRLCKRIRELDLPLSLACWTRGDHVNEEILDALYQAGVRFLYFGLESAVPRVLRNTRKARPSPSHTHSLTPEERFIATVTKNIALAREKGFNDVGVSVIFGLPGETRDDALETIRVLRDLQVPYFHNLIQVYPGTRLWEERDRYHLTVEKFNGIWQVPCATVAAYDLATVPVLHEQERALVSYRKDELQCVVDAFRGDSDGPTQVPCPLFIRGPFEESSLGDHLSQTMMVGSRLVLCDIRVADLPRSIRRFLSPVSTPVVLTQRSAEAAENGVILRRVDPLSNLATLAFSVRVTNLAGLISLDGDGAAVVNPDNMALDKVTLATVVILGETDLPLLAQMSERLRTDSQLEVLCAEVLYKTTLADHAMIFDDGRSRSRDRTPVYHDRQVLDNVSGAFPELRPLVAGKTDAIREVVGPVWSFARFTEVLRLLSDRLPVEEFAGSRWRIAPLDSNGVRILQGNSENQSFSFDIENEILRYARNSRS